MMCDDVCEYSIYFLEFQFLWKCVLAHSSVVSQLLITNTGKVLPHQKKLLEPTQRQKHTKHIQQTTTTTRSLLEVPIQRYQHIIRIIQTVV